MIPIPIARLYEHSVRGIAKECREILRDGPGTAVHEAEHGTYWTNPFGQVYQYHLLNESGRYCDPADGLLWGGPKRFHHGRRFPNILKLVNDYPEMINLRMNVMHPGSGLSPHKEIVDLEAGSKARFHLPVMTNDKARLMVGWGLYPAEEGWVYFFNNGMVHSAINPGETPRVHLVWDCAVNERLEQLVVNGTRLIPRESMVPTAYEEEGK